MELLESTISDKICIRYLDDEEDEEDVLYKEYSEIKERIAFLYQYIESLNALLDEEKLQKEYGECGTRLFEDCVLALYYKNLAKEHLDDEEKRILGIVDSSIRTLRRKEGKPLDFYDRQKKDMLHALQSEDQEYLAAEEDYEQAVAREEEKKRILSDFRRRERSSLDANRTYINDQIRRAYEEIDSLNSKKVEILEKIDYIVYGDTNNGDTGVSKQMKPQRR